MATVAMATALLSVLCPLMDLARALFCTKYVELVVANSSKTMFYVGILGIYIYQETTLNVVEMYSKCLKCWDKVLRAIQDLAAGPDWRSPHSSLDTWRRLRMS